MVPGYDQSQAQTGLTGLTKPDPREKAAQIVAWAICWPWNLVWTICVYNPFRYIGEFLLKEIQSALFEISNGQFRSIERDLSLDPPAPPYPIQTRRNDTETSTMPVEVANVAAPETIVDDHPMTKATTEPSSQRVPNSDSPVAIEVAADIAKLNVVTEQAVQPVVAETSPEESIQELPVEVEAEPDVGGSADSYTWAPPATTAFVPLSAKPLRAVKYESESAGPATPTQPNDPSKPKTDPWFETHAPNR
jgi:hypothetical protein